MKALIVGSSGQDGRLLTEQLAERGFDVYGINRVGLHVLGSERSEPCDIENSADVLRIIASIKPDRVFYVAAYHGSSEAVEVDEVTLLRCSLAVNAFALLNFLTALNAQYRKGRLLYAASSRIFGKTKVTPQDETTEIAPVCSYGISKVAGMRHIHQYRAQGLHLSTAILYNHESAYRAPQFVTQRVVRAVVAIERGESKELVLADLDAIVDWGYAPEYTEAMIGILDHGRADDFVVASGTGHTVRDLVAMAFEYAGLQWERVVKIDRSRVQLPLSEVPIVGKSAKLFAATGWRAKTDLPGIVRIMIDAERKRRRQA